MSFINNCFKTFFDKLFIKCPQLTTVESKTLFSPLPYLREISSQTAILGKTFVDFFFTTSETELDYYHEKVNERVASQVAKQLQEILGLKS